MTAPAQPGPDGPRPELLAAYADGELDPATREVVERWLAANPQARAALDAQRDLSPVNWRLWQQAEPPTPTEDTWAVIRQSVDDALLPMAEEEEAPHGRRVGVWLFGGMIAAAAAAAIALWLAQPAPPRTPHTPQPVVPEVARPVVPDDPLAGVAVLPVASEDDVELFRLPGDAAGRLAVGRDPLPDRVVLAGPGDVELDEFDPDEWPDGGPKMPTGPKDAPMIFARPR